MTPRYTDQMRWPNGYATAAQSLEPGYLKAKFDAMARAQQERAQVVTQIKPRVKARTP